MYKDTRRTRVPTIPTHHSMIVLCAAGLVLGTPVASANTGVSTEAVNAYSCGALTTPISEAAHFTTKMLSKVGYTGGVVFTDATVFSTDFRDPDLPGFGGVGADQVNFDRQQDAIAYFAGHGTCDDQTTTVCTTTAGCPDIAGLTKICTRFTESPLRGRCMYSRPRNIVTDQSGSSCTNINVSTNNVRWGESANSGAFAGAGTNGGVNAVALSISCGITPDMYISEYVAAFAGVSSIHTIMPTRQGSDTSDADGRGVAWANHYVANSNSSVGSSWVDGINQMSGGANCAFGGGNHGINGCGAHVSMAVDTSKPLADWSLLTENWTQLRDDGNDPVGQGWMSAIFTCNYDCNAHPWRL
jgi:hypothetical protein